MSFTMRVIAVLCACAVLVTGPAYATVIHVPADHATIQAGIDASVTGDTVLVADGTYTGAGNHDIDFGGKNVCLLSQNGAAYTIIDCGGSGRGFSFHSGEDSMAIVDGFTITGGVSVLERGGGILCVGSSPTIKRTIFRGNSSGTPGPFGPPGYGGGLAAIQSSPTIVQCLLIDNAAWDGEECIPFPECDNFCCTNVPGRGSALFFSESGARIEQCIISYNYGGSTVAGGEPVCSCTNIFGNGGGNWVGSIADQGDINGNLSVEPGFCNRTYGDYHLSPTSPCLPANNDCGLLIGALGTGCIPGIASPGDADCDGLVDLTDVVIVGNVLDGLIDLTGTCSEGADDVNEDGVVNEDDYNLLFDTVAGVGP